MGSINNTTLLTTIELHNFQLNKDRREKVKKVLMEVGCTSAKIVEQTYTGSLTTGPLTFNQSVGYVKKSSKPNPNSPPVVDAVSLDVNNNKRKQVIQKKNSEQLPKKDYNCKFPNCDKVISATVQQRHRIMQEHALKHSTVPLIKCDEPGCTRAYKTMKSKKEHYQAAHKNVDKKYGLLDFLKSNAEFEALYRQCFGTQINIEKQKTYKTPKESRKRTMSNQTGGPKQKKSKK
ncbi:hypothetical protein CRE_07407 [Caenorhabditis remanei]|uniref:Uncharacterized protein n=1 Tax=Caenorhabditis remanei TaxID=31234 RepID=E3M207_CAERE|nr:hypothetical protein CRE_07407 [Caenorhabditis remanei]